MTEKAGTGEYEQKLFVRRLLTIGGIRASPRGVGVLANAVSIIVSVLLLPSHYG